MRKSEAFRILIVSNEISVSSDTLDRISEAGVQDEVSAVRNACMQLGYSVEELAVRSAETAFRAIHEAKPDVIFNLCEGLNGISELEMHFAAMLELLEIPFTGANPMTLGIARNKPLAKKIFAASGIPVPNGISLFDVPQTLPEPLRYPLICKPAAEDASLGIFRDAVIRDLAGLKENIAKLLEKYPSDGVLLEEYIDGREFCVAIVSDGKQTKALPPSEIDFSALPEHADRITSYEAKWLESHELYQATPSHCPADLPDTLKKRLQETALSVHRSLGANSYGRVDFRMNQTGEIFVLEYNPNPDISIGAGFSKALDAEGILYSDFIKMGIAEAFERFMRRKNETK